MFLKNCWYVAAWDHELSDGRMLARTILEEAVLLYKSETGRVVALQDPARRRCAKANRTTATTSIRPRSAMC
jgi:vanillate O-demethylase monooxygenase subunit